MKDKQQQSNSDELLLHLCKTVDSEIIKLLMDSAKIIQRSRDRLLYNAEHRVGQADYDKILGRYKELGLYEEIMMKGRTNAGQR